MKIDHTNNKDLSSWVESANSSNHPFPIQNLPFGIFSPKDNTKRVGVAIGDKVLDIHSLQVAGLITIENDPEVFAVDSLNNFMALGLEAWNSVRTQISELLRSDTVALRDNTSLQQLCLFDRGEVELHLPFDVTGYTDFYASREHATNVGIMFRDPENALMPNWLHIPIGYNGRASTVVVSGTDIHRPLGQIKPPGHEKPIMSECRKLDIELEMGAIVGTPNKMGQPVSIDEADAMIFGYVLLNDWSARDIQVWEYQPLGPFQSKVFASTISPWVVTAQALAPFRVEGPAQSPEPLPYLRQKNPMNFDVHLEVDFLPEGESSATTISKTNFKYMYWSSAQQLAHHAVGGCAMRSGDLLGSGTISGPDQDSFGSLLELTWNGERPLKLDGGVERTFIKDNDELILSGWSQGDGFRIGFGECRGRILPAPDRAEWL